MSNNPLTVLGLGILENMSESLGCSLHRDNYGLSLYHSLNSVKWIQMDKRTSAFICELDTKKNISIDFTPVSNSCYFHGVFIMKGNLEFNDTYGKNTLGLMAKDSVYFQNLEDEVNLRATGKTICKFVIISHLKSQTSSLQKNLVGGFFKLDQMNDNLYYWLERIFRTFKNSNSCFELKGLLFLILANSTPEYYINIGSPLSTLDSNKNREKKIKPRRTKRTNVRIA